MSIKTFDELAKTVIANSKKSHVAVVNADDAHTIEAVSIAQKDGLIEAILIGDKDAILKELAAQGEVPSDFNIIDAADTQASLAAAVSLINSADANVLMKGHLETADFMRAILNKDNDLRAGDLLSVAGFYQFDAYHKLLALTDQAINAYPDLKAKKSITQNAVKLLNAFGINNPKVAVLAAIEKLNPKMPETIDADALKTMNQKGEITACTVDGPLSLDIATSKEAADIKGYQSEVAGDADLLVAPDLICGNILAKALTGFAKAITAGTVLGAKIPVVLTPRSAEATDKYYSLALAAYTAERF